VQVLDSVQQQVLKEFGYEGTASDLTLFRSGLGMYPNDKELHSIPYYSQFNRAEQGSLDINDAIPNITLHSLNFKKEPFSLQDYYYKQVNKIINNKQKLPPLIIIAGSIT